MRYTITRKINLKRFFPDMQYESIDFAVLEADSKEEANEELAIWVDQWIKDKTKEVNDKTKEVNDKRTPEEKFDDSLDKTPRETLSLEEDIKASKVINNKK